jgi:Zn-dependent oligopeptidase
LIYETGGSREPAELYRELMARDPDPDALFRREGLLPSAPKP